MTGTVITAARRTPVGSFLGAFGTVPAHELGQVGDQAAMADAGVEPARSRRSHPRPGADRRPGPEPGAPGADGRRHRRRKARHGASTRSAVRACAPSRLAAQAIADGRCDASCRGRPGIDVAVDPCAIDARAAPRWATIELVDTMIKDGLTDVFNGYHMGITAENLAEHYQITRAAQDDFAVASQNKAERARVPPGTSRTRSPRSPSRAARATRSSI